MAKPFAQNLCVCPQKIKVLVSERNAKPMKEMEITVSVLVPVYNTAPWMLKACFDSVLQQTRPVHQLVVVDDGSSDAATLQTLKDYQQRYPQVITMIFREHAGISVSRNAGMEQVTGSHLCFLDSDDFWSPDFVERLVTCAQVKDPDIVFCGYQEVDNAGKDVRRRIPDQKVLQDPQRYPYYTCGCGFRLYRTEYIRENGFCFPEGCIMEDEVFTDLTVSGTENIACVISYGYNVRDRADSFSRLRGKMNKATPDTIPFAQFAGALPMVTDAQKFQSQMLVHRVWHAMMASSFIFSCYSSRSDRAAIARKAAAFLRKEPLLWSGRKLVAKHPEWCGSRGDYLLLRLYRLGCAIGAELIFAEVFAFCARAAYFAKGIR